MKLLLTSAGFTNPSITQSLFKLAGKPASEISVAFIPTAMNPGEGDKSWFVENLMQLKEMNFKLLDIVDFSALPKELWFPRLQHVDVIVVSGGLTEYLIESVRKNGFDTELVQLLEKKVYVGISAGGMILSPIVALSASDFEIYDEPQDLFLDKEKGLSYIDFYVRPHFNSKDFPRVTKENLQEIATENNVTIYAIDDRSAVVVDGEKIEVISEGEHHVFEQ